MFDPDFLRGLQRGEKFICHLRSGVSFKRTNGATIRPQDLPRVDLGDKNPMRAINWMITGIGFMRVALRIQGLDIEIGHVHTNKKGVRVFDSTRELFLGGKPRNGVVGWLRQDPINFVEFEIIALESEE